MNTNIKELEKINTTLNLSNNDLNFIIKQKQKQIDSLENLLITSFEKKQISAIKEITYDGNGFEIQRNDINSIFWIESLYGATYDKQTNEFIWLPNLSEQIEFGIESGKKLYTKIDTIFFHGKNKENFTIALNTYSKYEEGENKGENDKTCFGCGQVLSLISFKLNYDKSKYELSYFKKYVAEHGTYGRSGYYSFMEFSDYLNFVKVSVSYTHYGEVTEWETWYSDGKESFNFESSLNNGANNGKTDTYTDLVVNKPKMTITLITKGTDTDEKGKIIKVNKVVKYKVDEQGRITKQ